MENRLRLDINRKFGKSGNKEYYGKDAHTIVFNMQEKIIRKKALESDCIFVGRCADAVLAKEKGVEVLNIFVSAPLNERINRIMKVNHLNMKDAVIKIKKMDKKRELYYKYFAKKDWGKSSEYDLTINSARWGQETCIKMIQGIYEQMEWNK